MIFYVCDSTIEFHNAASSSPLCGFSFLVCSGSFFCLQRFPFLFAAFDFCLQRSFFFSACPLWAIVYMGSCCAQIYACLLSVCLRGTVLWMPEVFLSLSDGILRSGERNLVFPLLFRRSEREKRLAARVVERTHEKKRLQVYVTKNCTYIVS